MTGFRFASAPTLSVGVRMGRRGGSLPAGRSLLAGLLAAGEAIDYFCCIGQCFRCECVVDGELVRACMYYPTGGESVRLDPGA